MRIELNLKISSDDEQSFSSWNLKTSSDSWALERIRKALSYIGYMSELCNWKLYLMLVQNSNCVITFRKDKIPAENHHHPSTLSKLHTQHNWSLRIKCRCVFVADRKLNPDTSLQGYLESSKINQCGSINWSLHDHIPVYLSCTADTQNALLVPSLCPEWCDVFNLEVMTIHSAIFLSTAGFGGMQRNGKSTIKCKAS